MKSLSNTMAAALAVTALAGCGKSPEELGYVPVNSETLANAPETPMTAIIYNGEVVLSTQVESVAACFNYQRQKGQKAGSFKDGECVDRQGNIALYIRDNIPMMRGKLQASAATPQ